MSSDGLFGDPDVHAAADIVMRVRQLGGELFDDPDAYAAADEIERLRRVLDAWRETALSLDRTLTAQEEQLEDLRAELQASRDGNLAESTIRVLRDAIRRLRNAGDALEQRLAEHGDPDDFQAREMWAAANIGLQP